MSENNTRRDFLRAAGGLGAGVLTSAAAGSTSAGDRTDSIENLSGDPDEPPIFAEKRDWDSDGLEDVITFNPGNAYSLITGEDVQSERNIALMSEAGLTREVYNNDYETDPILSEFNAAPKTPISKESSLAPETNTTAEFEAVELEDAVGYQLKQLHRYDIDGNPRLWSNVSVLNPEDTDVFVLNLRLRNLSDEQLKLDQDETDIHDGVNILNGMELWDSDENDGDYRFNTSGERYSFADLDQWQRFGWRGPVTLYNGEEAATFDLLDGDTGRRMLVHEEGTIDALTDELHLDPGESVDWTVGIGLSEKGGRRAARYGRRQMDTARHFAQKYFE